MNTYATKASDIERKWYVVDAEGVVLGRMAAEIAKILRGKHKANFVPNIDCGDYVVVINADKVKLTGNKLAAKKYFTENYNAIYGSSTQVANRFLKLRRLVPNYKNAYIYINHLPCQILSVCMDMIIVDITSVDCKVGDIVNIISNDNKKMNSVKTFAKHLNTISYEIVTNLNPSRFNLITVD